MWEKITEAIANLHWTEGFAVLFGIFYIVLAARENAWCWFWGIISCALWAWAAYALYALYIDAMLQVFYVGISFAGIWQWRYGSRERNTLKINRLPLQTHVWLLITGSVLTILTGYLFDRYTAAAATYLDAFTTVFSVITTFLVVRKVLENWLYWMVIDAVYIYLYSSRGSLLFTLLFASYLIIAINGYLHWRKVYREDQGGIFKNT